PANGWKTYSPDRVGHDVQASYQLPRNLTVFASGRNVFNRSQAGFIQAEGSNRMITDHRNYGALWTIGLRGEF
ncbi:MAG: hypothetical protein ACREH8_20595, partial [Opitutaceae bacterium]